MNFEPDEKLLLKCLLKIEGRTDSTGIRIRQTEIHDDVPIQTNNTSKVVKIKIEYEVDSSTRVAALAVKIPFLRTKKVYEFFKGLQFFDKEARFYKTIAPRLQELLHFEVAPTLFASDDQQVLFMDDLSAQGYKIQVEGQLDFEHSFLTLQHVARMHAASHVLYREDPHCMDDLIKQQFLISEEFVGKLYLEVKPLLEALTRAKCLSANVVTRFSSAVEKARSDIVSSLENSDFSVLNHGDLKAHNILYKHNEQKKPTHCSLIDFQVCYWTSPLLDIIFFSILSMQREVFAKDFDKLLMVYLSTLNSTFEKLNCDVRLTEEQLRRDWDSLKAYKIYSFLFRTVIDIREFCKQFEYAKYEEASPEMLENLSQSPEIQERVGFWLGEFEKTGVF